MNSKGQVWGEFMASLFTILAMATVYIILHQVYLYDFHPWAIREGVNATNLGYIDLAWTLFPVVIVLAYSWGTIAAGREQTRTGGFL